MLSFILQSVKFLGTLVIFKSNHRNIEKMNGIQETFDILTCVVYNRVVVSMLMHSASTQMQELTTEHKNN